jgi:hypothetical protein
MAGINQDPFEEFEFRPINEGLGFHRRNKNESVQSPRATTSPVTALTSGFTSPLPRQEPAPRSQFNIPVNIPTIEDDSIAKAQSAVNEILKNLNHKRQLDFATEIERQRSELKKSKPYFFAATLDGMLIFAGFLMSMILMLTVTKVDLFMNLNSPETSASVYLATVGLFFSVAFIYMVINRAFMGFTPGEWAFDQYCGSPAQSGSLTYVPRLALRTTVVMLTGFVTLTLASYLLNRDLAGEVSGVTLHKKSDSL